MKPIWIVDDDPSIRFVLEKALARENLPTRSFTHPREVLDALADVTAGDPARQGPQVLVSDIRMPGGSGLQLLEKVRELQPGLPVIIMTAYSDLDSAVSAFQRGAFEYLPKPFDLPKAVELIRRAVEESQREEVTEERQTATPEMLGQAPAMQDVFRAIGRLSQSQTRLLRVLSDGQFYRVGGHAAQSARQLGVEPKRIADSALARLEQFAFPGNVRQLENICHWLTVMAPAQVISLQDLPPEVLEAPVYQPPVRATAGAEPAATTVTSMPVAPLAPVAPVAQPAPELVGGLSPAAPVSIPVPVSASVAAASWSADAVAAPVAAAHSWEQALETEAQKLLAGGQPEVWDALTRRFESRLIRTALVATHGRRMEAAQRLGIGRNTITRKIQELGLDAPDEA
eukprot:gene1630-1599_t